jgi:hypothetical protein
VNNQSGISLTPGQYQFRPNPFVPWINVKVFRESVANKENLRVRWAGLEIDFNKLAQRGEWKPL